MVDIFEFVRKDESRGPWHIGWESGYFNEPSHTLCGAELYGYTDSAPDLPEGGRLCANCRKELERRTRATITTRRRSHHATDQKQSR